VHGLLKPIPSEETYRTALADNLESSLDGLRNSGEQIWIATGLVTRAWWKVLENSPNEAGGDLDSAAEIAERGPMKLFMADIHLCRGRLFREKTELQKARLLIEDCGYWRRKDELEDVELAASGW